MAKGLNDESELHRPPSLDARSAFEWRQLTRQVLGSRRQPICSNVNATLLAAAEREPQSPLAPAFRLWMADNCARDRMFAEGLAAYDAAIDCAQSAPRLIDGHDPATGALRHKAGLAALAGDRTLAIRTFRELAKLDPAEAGLLLHAGLLAEEVNDPDQAAELYRSIAAKAASARADDQAELARRALLRLEVPQSSFASEARQVSDVLVSALALRNVGALQAAVSTTHFAVGPIGGHGSFDTEGLLDELYRDLERSRIAARGRLFGSGDKLYLRTSGWRGKWFRGDVFLVITRAPRGWQWTGLGVAAPNEHWLERWRPAVKQKNQPLPFDLLAPWPAGQSFKAGGLTEFAKRQAAILALPPFFGSLLAFYLSRNPCGFGPRGFYYNQWPTHDGADAFAIDFTRYRQNWPYVPESAGTPVLAAKGGIVRHVLAYVPSGHSGNTANRVHITHPDPADPTNKPERFRSIYLHFAGPYDITVSEFMEVVVGTRLGPMDDTGTSWLNHLHFSIHDNDTGASVRPTPMNGVRLEDGDDGACVRSTNVEFREGSLIEITTFAGQNWVITPAALAVNEAPPARIQDQKFLMVLSGVAIVDLKGNSTSQWRWETISIRPDVNAPMQYAIARHAMPTPPGVQGANYTAEFQVEQWAPFATLSSIYNKDDSDNSGFAVDVWRPNPFMSGTDVVSNAPLNNLFAGIQVDVAVRDTDAWLYRVSYNIALIGKIVFRAVIIT